MKLTFQKILYAITKMLSELFFKSTHIFSIDFKIFPLSMAKMFMETKHHYKMNKITNNLKTPMKKIIRIKKMTS